MGMLCSVLSGLKSKLRDSSSSKNLSGNITETFSFTSSLREAEKKDEDIFEELPLFKIQQEYGTTEAGKSVAKLFAKYHQQIPTLKSVLV